MISSKARDYINNTLNEMCRGKSFQSECRKEMLEFANSFPENSPEREFAIIWIREQ